jgi:Leucine-rich repeat (LRR) protein
LFIGRELKDRDISGNALTSLPDRFDALTTLANINAASNNLTGSIPTTLLTHPTLKTLNLASNSFMGDVIINSVNLTSLALGRNQLSSIRIGEGSGLVKVDLADNKFQGVLPDMTSSPDLQIFDVSNNKSVPPVNHNVIMC